MTTDKIMNILKPAKYVLRSLDSIFPQKTNDC